MPLTLFRKKPDYRWWMFTSLRMNDSDTLEQGHWAWEMVSGYSPRLDKGINVVHFNITHPYFCKSDLLDILVNLLQL